MSTIIENLRSELISVSDEKTRLSGERFFKEEIRLYGVKSAVVKNICKAHFTRIPDKSKQNIFALCEELWGSGILEECGIACEWSYMVRKEFEPSDFKIFEKWVGNYVNNWAACDSLCNHTVGALVEMYPSCLDGLKKWAQSPNRWMKRASAVSLIIPARRGKFLEDIFEISNILLYDGDDMVQKGYGWMLKAASQAYPDQVFNYVFEKKATMPRTSLRYAIEKLPSEMKKRAMEK